MGSSVHSGVEVQVRVVSVVLSGQDASHASYGSVLAPPEAVPAAHAASQLAAPNPGSATNSAQLYSIVTPRHVSAKRQPRSLWQWTEL